MEISFKLKPPVISDTIAYESPPGRRQDGMRSTTIHISELNRQQAEQYAQEMKEAFLREWESKVVKNSER